MQQNTYRVSHCAEWLKLNNFTEQQVTHDKMHIYLHTFVICKGGSTIVRACLCLTCWALPQFSSPTVSLMNLVSTRGDRTVAPAASSPDKSHGEVLLSCAGSEGIWAKQRGPQHSCAARNLLNCFHLKKNFTRLRNSARSGWNMQGWVDLYGLATYLNKKWPRSAGFLHKITCAPLVHVCLQHKCCTCSYDKRVVEIISETEGNTCKQQMLLFSDGFSVLFARFREK